MNSVGEDLQSHDMGTHVRRLNKPVRLTEQCWPDGTRPLVSISCITYNQDSFIRGCIDGFLAQETNFPVEVLVHDDASTDQTPSVIREYEVQYPHIIKPIYQVQNQYSLGKKPSLAFNLPRAKGKYIATCEGDDYWADPLKLQTQVDFLEANPDFVICYHDAKIVDELGNLVSESKLPEYCKKDFSSEELMKGAWTLTLTRCFRNLPAQLPEEIFKVLNVDVFYTAVIGRFGKGKYLGEIRPAVYRRHPTSIWSSLDSNTQRLNSFNSYIYMYQYHLRETGQDFAVEFLFEKVVPVLGRLYPEKNPLRLAARKQAAIRERQRHAMADMRSSHTYRLAAALLWPLKLLHRVAGRLKSAP